MGSQPYIRVLDRTGGYYFCTSAVRQDARRITASNHRAHHEPEASYIFATPFPDLEE